MSEQSRADGGQRYYPPPVGPYRPGQTYGRATGPRVGFWTRFAAFFVDSLILGVPAFVLESIVRKSGSGSAIVIVYVLSFVAQILYFGLLEGGRTGQTVGKHALGIRVIDRDTGQPIGFGRAVLRFFGKLVSLLPCYLGYLWMLWDSEKQCWHDKFASDYVVPVSAYPVQ